MHKLPGRFATNTHPTFAIIREVNAGGMGFIIHARHRQTGHDLVLKFILTQSADIIDLERFQREGLLLAALNHPNIVKVHAADVEAGVPFLSMEWIEGQSLKSVIQSALKTREFQEFNAVWEIFLSLSQALAHCHQHKILHRDIKPENVLIENGTGRVVLVDFGLAKQLKPYKPDQPSSFKLTQPGQILGTPAYMSPEQIHQEDEQIGPATDIWGLGATLYHFTTLEAPFQGDSLLNLMTKILNNPAPELQSLRPDSPEWLNVICKACLNKSAKLRPNTQTLLNTFLRQEPPELEAEPEAKANKKWLIAVAVLALVIVIPALIFSQSRNKQEGNVAKHSTAVVSSLEPELIVERLEEENCVFLKPGEKSRGRVRNTDKLTLTVDGRVHELAVNPKGQFTVPVTVQSKPIAVRISLKNEDSKAMEFSYYLVPIRFKQPFLSRALFDRKQWNRIGDKKQDRIIDQFKQSLKSGFSFIDTKVYECRGQSHRIASFRHKKTGIQFHLLPGGSFRFGSTADQRFQFQHYMASAPYEASSLKEISPAWKVFQPKKYLGSVKNMKTAEHSQIPMTVGPFLIGRYELSLREWNLDLSKFDKLDQVKRNGSMLVERARIPISFGGTNFRRFTRGP
ncbi:MAG: serine/threonine-protein kinase [Planctomycetota bacterium]|nr:serine/threonine-protein kinase [Planctomycetota bacterium]